MFYGNAYAKEAIRKYIASASFGPILLSGPKGVGKSILAHQIAKSALCVGDRTENCSCQSCRQVMANPDFLRIGIPEDKKVIGVEIVEEVVRKASLLPLVSERNVVLIDDMDKMTEAAQNKLLKTLEDNQHNLLVIGISSGGDGILDTIESRMQKVAFHNLNAMDFKGFCKENNIEEYFEVLYAATGGVPGRALLIDTETLALFKKISGCIFSEPKTIFKELRMVKEKGKSNFFTTSKFVKELLCFMEVVYLQMLKCNLKISVANSLLPTKRRSYTNDQLINSIRVINKNLTMMRKNISYNMNDFFMLVMEIVEIVEEKGGY